MSRLKPLQWKHVYTYTLWIGLPNGGWVWGPLSGEFLLISSAPIHLFRMAMALAMDKNTARYPQIAGRCSSHHSLSFFFSFGSKGQLEMIERHQGKLDPKLDELVGCRS